MVIGIPSKWRRLMAATAVTHLVMTIGMVQGQFQPMGTDDIFLETLPSWHSNDSDGRQRIALGDLNGDGYPEVYSTCRAGIGFIGRDRVYTNVSGQLDADPSWIQDPPFSCYAADMADADLDGDLDVAVADSNGGSYYGNSGGVLESEPTWQSMFQCATMDVGWAWVTQDGYPDLLAANNSGLQPEQGSALFRNMTGPLGVLPSWNLTGWQDYCCAWGDIDNDGDIDLCLGAFDERDRIYRSTDGFLENWAHWTSYLTDGTLSLAFADIDADGWLDLIEGTYDAPVRVYFNLGEGEFETSPSWSSTVEPRVWQIAAGDIDNDGDIDLACGTEDPSDGDLVFENTGSGLNPVPSWSSALASRTMGVALGDIDRDGDLDLVTASYASHLYLYQNLVQAANTAPQPPGSYSAVEEASLVILTWGNGSDVETPTNVLTYNLRVGTAPGLADVVYSEIGPGNTHPSFGLMWHARTRTLHSLPAGTYYWSVQTVDAGLARSNWAPEQSFESSGSSVEDQRTNLPFSYALEDLYPNPFNVSVIVNFTLPNSSTVRLAVYNTLGQLVTVLFDERASSGNHQVRWDGVSTNGSPVGSGIYLFVLTTPTGSSVKKGILLR